ncbi:MAG: hypothetical protein HY204_02990 [Nitrospirae bacterium]|nr:hypothetical protein [Nitrospirota bacterium]
MKHSHPWPKRLRGGIGLLGLLLSLGLLYGCAGGGGGGGGGSTPNPAEGSTWDQMGWDQGKWG